MITSSDWLDNKLWIDRSDVDVDAYCAQVTEKYDFDLSEKLKFWKKNGFVILERVVNVDVIDELIDDIQHIKENNREYELGVELRGRQGKIEDFSHEELDFDGIKFNSIHTISAAAEKLSLTKAVCDFLRHLFKDSPAILQSLTFYKGSQQPAHIDYPYVRTQSIISHLAASWIPLEDIHPDSGPLQYYPGSHNTKVSDYFDWGKGSIVLESDSTGLPTEFSDYLISRMELHNIDPVIFCPKKGDALIWSGNLVHGGSKIKNQNLTRKSYVTHYTSLKAYPDAHMKPNALSNGDYFSVNNGYSFDWPWMDGIKKIAR